MKAYITTCCKEKSKILGEIPMLERYISDRIQSIYQKSKEDDVAFFVLSGKFGLLTPSNKIPWYDKILDEYDVLNMSKKVKHQLIIFGISEIELYINPSWANYNKTIKLAAQELKIKFRMIPNKDWNV